MSYQPTYEELKPLPQLAHGLQLFRYQPTYEELKLQSPPLFSFPQSRYQPTYEELKLKSVPSSLEINSLVTSLPMRN